ncbi:MAG: hypothetical protein QXL88_00830 [Candidatus Pacearchaeota archaeon]
MKKSLVFLFATFILFTLAFSARAEISVESKLITNAVCPSGTIVIEEQVSSSISDSFTIALSGTASKFATAVPSGFSLAAGETKSFFIYITPSSRATPGTYVLEISIIGLKASKRLSHEIIVENCRKTTLEVFPSRDKICACESKSFELKLSNKGIYLENYVLSLEGSAAKWINLSGTSFSLAKNTSVVIPAQISIPCDVKGNYSATFKAKSTSLLAQAETSLQLEIVPCYDYSIEAKSYLELCENEKIVLPVTLKNFGTADNLYKINVKAPSWVALDKKSLEVASNKQDAFNLIIKPPFNTTGDFSIIIQTLSEKGKIMKELEIKLKVFSCYGVTLETEKKQDKICVGLNKNYAATIKNIGKFNNTFNILLEAPSWASVTEKTITLGPEEAKNFSLVLSPAKDVKPTDYAMILIVKDPVSGVESKNKLDIAVISTEECYKPSISAEKEEQEVNRDSTAVLMLVLENKGIEEAEYAIEISGTAVSFSRINPSTVKLEAGKTQSIYIYIAPPIETPIGNYTLNVAARVKDSTIVSSKTIKINVLKEQEVQEIQENITTTVPTITPEAIKEIEKKPNIFTRIIEFFKNLFRSRAIEEKNITNITTNKPPVLKKNIPDIKLEPGETFILNLSEYIEDPEHEPLLFVTVKPLNIDVRIENEIVTIRATEDFEGTREITFYATDGENFLASNKIKIIVTKSEEKTKTENATNVTEITNITTGKAIKESFFKMYKNYIIGAIVIAIIIIILISGLYKKILKFFEEEVPEENKKKKQS